MAQSAAAVGRSKTLKPNQHDLKDAMKAILGLREGMRLDGKKLEAQEMGIPDSENEVAGDKASFRMAPLGQRGMASSKAKSKKKRK